jgi:RHS repeat-associated protein
VVWKESYSPYGDRQQNQAAALANRQWFGGKPQDSETGLSYFGARYYDPVVGRFMGIDSVGFSEKNLHSFNRYSYGNNNPYRFVDADGREPNLVIYDTANGGRVPSAAEQFRPYGEEMGRAMEQVGTWYLTAMSVILPELGAPQRVVAAARLIRIAERIDNGLKEDSSHRAASFLSKDQLEAGQVFTIRGGDNVERTLLQTNGALNGKNGVYEYILEAGNVTHQRFIEGGNITGIPNQIVPKAP